MENKKYIFQGQLSNSEQLNIQRNRRFRIGIIILLTTITTIIVIYFIIIIFQLLYNNIYNNISHLMIGILLLCAIIVNFWILIKRPPWNPNTELFLTREKIIIFGKEIIYKDIRMVLVNPNLNRIVIEYKMNNMPDYFQLPHYENYSKFIEMLPQYIHCKEIKDGDEFHHKYNELIKNYMMNIESK